MASSTAITRQPLSIKRLELLKSNNIRSDSEDGSTRSTSTEFSEEEESTPTWQKKELATAHVNQDQQHLTSLRYDSESPGSEEEKQPEEDGREVERPETPVLLGTGDASEIGKNTAPCRYENDAMTLFAILPFADVHDTEHVRQHPKLGDCPKGHGLAEFSTHHHKFFCNGCQAIQDAGAVLFGCRLCDFDLCSSCVSSNVLETCAKSQKRCPSDHGIVATRWKDTRICDICRRHLEPGKKMMSCRLCDYDECLKCAKGKEPSYYEILGLTLDATSEDIERAAWTLSRDSRKLAVKNPNNEDMRLEATSRFQEVAIAFGVLIDPDLRKDYDASLARGEDMFDAPTGRTAREATQDASWLMYSSLFSPPEIRRSRKTKPSFSHGAYVAVAGAVLAPVNGCLVGLVACGQGIVDGAVEVAKGAQNGGSSFIQGIQGLTSGKSTKQCSTKVFISEHVRPWHRSRRAKPWRNMCKVVTEPLYGITVGTVYIVSGAVGGAAICVGGSAYGVGFNLAAGQREIRETWKQRRRSSCKASPVCRCL